MCRSGGDQIWDLGNFHIEKKVVYSNLQGTCLNHNINPVKVHYYMIAARRKRTLQNWENKNKIITTNNQTVQYKLYLIYCLAYIVVSLRTLPRTINNYCHLPVPPIQHT